MQFQRESLSKCLPDIMVNINAHYDEARWCDSLGVYPSFSRYQKIEEVGGLRCYTARDEHGELIGYNVYFIQSHIHHSNKMFASQDNIYIRPDKRGFGRDFIGWCDKELEKDGVDYIHYHVPSHTHFGKILVEKGYKVIEHIYARKVGE